MRPGALPKELQGSWLTFWPMPFFPQDSVRICSQNQEDFGTKLLPRPNNIGQNAFWDVQNLCFDTIQSLRSTDNSFDLIAWFPPRYALRAMKSHIDKRVWFQMTLPRMDSNQVEEASQGCTPDVTLFFLTSKNIWTCFHCYFVLIYVENYTLISYRICLWHKLWKTQRSVNLTTL